MNEFLFDAAFRQELSNSAHQDGEVTLLESVLRPGMVALEGGANRGVTAVAIAKAVGDTGHVHAFEPVPEYFGWLKGNIARNRVANITAHNLALSDRNGPLDFYKHGEGSGVASAEDAEQIHVEAITIPKFVANHGIVRVDFLNLDCEGSELLIFQNSRDLLIEQGPAIFCEVHRGYLEQLGHSVPQLVDFLVGLGYKVTPVQVNDLDDPSDVDSCSHIFAAHALKTENVLR